MTAPKGRPTPPNPRTGPGILPRTAARRFSGHDHRPPRSGVNDNGNPWRGASRVQDRATQRRRNRRTWLTEKRRTWLADRTQARREAASAGPGVPPSTSTIVAEFDSLNRGAA